MITSDIYSLKALLLFSVKWVVALFFLIPLGCSRSKDTAEATFANPVITASLVRNGSSSLSPIRVSVEVSREGIPLPGQALTVTAPRGVLSAVSDQGNGEYLFTLTPSATGSHEINMSVAGINLTKKALVLDQYGAGVGQPHEVGGDVNTEGYEDGITVTPDGEYLFVQYGPFSFSGPLFAPTICSSGSYSIGYDLNTCAGRSQSSFVFGTRGPYGDERRPRFPLGGISGGRLLHVPSLVVGGVANGITGFPTVFYGFKRQPDGTFREPFKVAFNDDRALNGPFGLSLQPHGDGTATFLVAWDNYFNHLGDDKPDIYTGTLTFGQDKNLGDVVYGGGTYASITPSIGPVGFPSHAGVQGNPHLYSDAGGTIRSIWTDDEEVTQDLSVYRLTAGTFPNGTWVKDSLPSPINTGAKEFQPFFTGSRLIFTRDSKIVSHAYRPANGACGAGFTSADCWGPEVILLSTASHTGVGEITAIGEPTVATRDGKTYLYFVYVEVKNNTGALPDLDGNAAFVEIP